MTEPLMLWCQTCGAPSRFHAPGLTVAIGARFTLRSPQWSPCVACGGASFANCKPFILTANDRRMLRSYRILAGEDVRVP